MGSMFFFHVPYLDEDGQLKFLPITMTTEDPMGKRLALRNLRKAFFSYFKRRLHPRVAELVWKQRHETRLKTEQAWSTWMNELTEDTLNAPIKEKPNTPAQDEAPS